MCDQMRGDAPGYTGRSVVRTPAIDDLAESGVAFENAYCASPVCSPARASWVTGLYPHGHHQYVNYSPKLKAIPGCSMPDDIITISDVLQAAGYKCANVGVWHLGDDGVPQHGFSEFQHTYSYHDLSLPDPHFAYLKELGLRNPYDPDLGMIRKKEFLPYAEITDPRQQRTTWVVDRSIEYLDRLDGQNPFFLMVGIKDPHPTMAPPREFLKEYPVEEIVIPTNFRDPLNGKLGYQSRGRHRLADDAISEQDFRVIMQHYYALVAHIDEQVGRIESLLSRKGLRENTILVFSSDHGEQLGNHGFVEKCLMYEESVRVPCVVSWPARLASGRRITTPLGGVDLMPTLLDLADCPLPADLDGRSVAKDLLSGSDPEETPVFAEIGDIGIFGNRTDPDVLACHVMVRYDGLKYVQNRDYEDELYDLEDDPGEMINLAANPHQSLRIASARKLIRDMVVRTGPDRYAWCLPQV